MRLPEEASKIVSAPRDAPTQGGQQVFGQRCTWRRGCIRWWIEDTNGATLFALHVSTVPAKWAKELTWNHTLQ